MILPEPGYMMYVDISYTGSIFFSMYSYNSEVNIFKMKRMGQSAITIPQFNNSSIFIFFAMCHLNNNEAY